MGARNLSDSDQSETSSGVERIADPDDYNLRRRLKELRDAKSDVKEMKDRAIMLAEDQSNESFWEEDRDRMVADKLVDYIHELRPSLSHGEDSHEKEFLSSSVSLEDGGEITIEEIATSRGRVDPDSEDWRHLTYQEAMRAWDVCNDYLEKMAGVRFENGAGPDANPVDPASRLDS